MQEFLLCFRIVGVDCFEIIIKRNFGIDDNIAVFRQMDNNIRAVKPFVFVIIRFLRVVILPFAQTGTFQKPVKLEFPPVALCLLLPLSASVRLWASLLRFWFNAIRFISWVSRLDLLFMLSSRALATSVLKALSCSANGDSSAESAVFCSAEKTRAEL